MWQTYVKCFTVHKIPSQQYIVMCKMLKLKKKNERLVPEKGERVHGGAVAVPCRGSAPVK